MNNAGYVWHSAGPGYQFDQGGFYSVMGAFSRNLGGALDPLLTASPDTSALSACPIEDFYPGRDYVDYFSVSYWGEGGVAGEGTDASRALYRSEIRRVLDRARALGLPLMISESTPAFIGTTSGEASVQWMRDYFALIEEYDIRIVSYIAAEFFDEGGNWGSPMFSGFFPPDARLHIAPAVKSYWEQRTEDSRYVQQGDADINALFGYVPSTAPLPWDATPEPTRPRLRWPNCPPPQLPGTGGWCLPLLP